MKALKLCLVVFVVVLACHVFFQVWYAKPFFISSGDGWNWIEKAEQKDFKPAIPVKIIEFFGLDGQTFFFFHAIMVFLVVPLLFFRLNNSLFTVIFYFSSQFVWLSDVTGSFAQSFIAVFFLLLVKENNVLKKILFVLLGLGVHFYGFFFLLAVFFIQVFQKNFDSLERAFFCTIPLTSTFSIPIKEKIVFALTFSQLLSLFSRILFLPLWFFVFRPKNVFFKRLAIFLLVTGFFLETSNNLRILSFLVFPFGILLNDFYKTCSPNKKKIVWVSIALMFLFNFFTWLNWIFLNYCQF